MRFIATDQRSCGRHETITCRMRSVSDHAHGPSQLWMIIGSMLRKNRWARKTILTRRRAFHCLCSCCLGELSMTSKSELRDLVRTANCGFGKNDPTQTCPSYTSPHIIQVPSNMPAVCGCGTRHEDCCIGSFGTLSWLRLTLLSDYTCSETSLPLSRQLMADGRLT